MPNGKSYISINFLHLAIVVLVITILVITGSFWNQFRTQIKLSKITVQSEKIYETHRDEFVQTINNNNKSSYTVFLNKINIPEKGIYQISILIKDDKGTYRLEDSRGERGLSVEEVGKLNLILSDKKSVNTAENLSLNTYNSDNYLYSFTPIQDGEKVIGFVVVSVRKNQNI